jgi:hypothetical protein
VVNNDIISSRHTSVHSVARVALDHASSCAPHLSPKALSAAEEHSKDRLLVPNETLITRTIVVVVARILQFLLPFNLNIAGLAKVRGVGSGHVFTPFKSAL